MVLGITISAASTERRKGATCLAVENVELPTLYAPLSKTERVARATQALALVGLANAGAC